MGGKAVCCALSELIFLHNMPKDDLGTVVLFWPAGQALVT